MTMKGFNIAKVSNRAIVIDQHANLNYSGSGYSAYHGNTSDNALSCSLVLSQYHFNLDWDCTSPD